MESSPPRKMGGPFFGPWRTLNVYLALGGGGGELSQMGGLTFSTIFFAERGQRRKFIKVCSLILS